MTMVMHLGAAATRQDRRAAAAATDRAFHAEQCARMLVQGLYTEVAVAMSRELNPEVKPALEHALRATKTPAGAEQAEQEWWDTLVSFDNRISYNGPPQGCRSTTVGDVMILEDRFYVVAQRSFVDVTDHVTKLAGPARLQKLRWGL